MDNNDLIENGISGMLVTSKNIDAIAKAIIYLMSHSEESIRMGERGRERILTGFSMSTVVDQYISMYDRLLHEYKE